MKLALNNLLLNSIEYSPPLSPIFIKVQVLENEFWLTILDEGPGIPEGVLPLIFDKFYQVSADSKGLGLGLGLAIVKFVRRHP